MRERHLSRREIRRIIEVENGETHTKLLLHHLAVCPECYVAGGYILDLYLSGALPERFSSVDVELAKSRADAPALFAKLSRFSIERQRGLVRDTRRFRSWGLAELMCKESLAAAPADPLRALELADMAVPLASFVANWQAVEEAWGWQLRSFAWAHLGNARRAVGELRSAEDAFTESDTWWKNAETMGDVLGYESTILALKASLRRTQGRFPEALILLDQALVSEGTTEERRSEILASRAFTLGEAGESVLAIDAFRKAIAATDRKRSVRLSYVLHHNLLDALTKEGRYEEARGIAPAVRALARASGTEIDLIRFNWIEARLMAAVGRREAGVRTLERVRTALLRLGLFFDVALASLELAELHLADGEHEAVREIAGGLLQIFDAQGVSREAYAALLVFCRAAESRVATAELAAATIESLIAGSRNLPSER